MSGSVERVREIAARASSNGQAEKIRAVEQSIETGFRITGDCQRQHKEALLFLNGKPLINRGGLFTMVALPGTGKTQTCAAIASAFVKERHNIDIDSLGFTFSKCEGDILYIDTENPKDDNILNFQGISKRLSNPGYSEGRLKGLEYYGLVDIANYTAMRKKIEALLEVRKYDALIIDGALDLSPGLNDEIGAKETVLWLRSLASRKDIGIITTLHPNKGTETAAGHIGAFLYRYCRAMLLIRPNKDDKSVKEITADFAQGKLSHCDPSQFEPQYIQWDERSAMMLSCDAPDTTGRKYVLSDFEYVFEQFRKNKQTTIPSSPLIDAYSNRIERGKELARQHIRAAVADGQIGKQGNGKNTKYYMHAPF